MKYIKFLVVPLLFVTLAFMNIGGCGSNSPDEGCCVIGPDACLDGTNQAECDGLGGELNKGVMCVNIPECGEACETEGPFLILNNQSYALCATADCFSFNQLAYCKCDVLRGDSISLPFDYGDNQNICTLNQQGEKNGFRASTFSFPEEEEFPTGKMAFYTCPGEMNSGGGVAARGSYLQCNGGLCFTSTRGKSFPGFDDRLRLNEIICSCPFSTICEPASVNNEGLGYQISGTYSPEEGPGPGVGGCSPEACGLCSAAALTEEQCDLPNPIAQIGIQEDIPVGAPTGTPTDLSILLLGVENVPPANSCLCQCVSDEDGICTQWTVIDESPLEVP